MTKRNTVSGIVTDIHRGGTTSYGNPIYSIMVGGPWYRISDNANMIYAINNREFREDVHTFYLTPAGRVSGYEH